MMSDVSGVALFSTLQWPKDALGERALLVIESHDPSVWRVDEMRTRDPMEALRVRAGSLRCARMTGTSPTSTTI